MNGHNSIRDSFMEPETSGQLATSSKVLLWLSVLPSASMLIVMFEQLLMDEPTGTAAVRQVVGAEEAAYGTDSECEVKVPEEERNELDMQYVLTNGAEVGAVDIMSD